MCSEKLVRAARGAPRTGGRLVVQLVSLTQTYPELPAATVKEYAATADDRRFAISKSLEHAMEPEEPLLPYAGVSSALVAQQ